jgi:hypothetical protein
MQPQLLLNFLSGAVDPRISYTRTGVGATRINSSGYVEAVAADTPRLNYDYVTLAPLGLKIEEARTNVFLQSNNFASASWAANRVTKPASAAITPQGLTNGVLARPDTTSSAFHYVWQAVSSANPSTITIVAKAGGYDFLRATVNDGANNAANRITFDLTTGVVSSQTGAVSGYVEQDQSGWFRCIFTASVDVATIFLHPMPSDTTGSFTGDGTSGVHLWFAQCEAGATPTSPIFTTTAPLTRNADVATITGTNFSDFWQATRGGVLVRALPSTVSGTRPLVQFDDNTADNIIALRGNTTNPELYIKATTDQAQIDAGTIAANTAYRLAGTWATDNCAANLNGGVPVLDTSATIPVVTQMRLGSDGTNYLNGHLQSIEYYNERILNSNLQVVSSPAGYRSIIGPVLRDSIIT